MALEDCFISRKASMRKRRKGLMKKLKELSILCDVQACGIIYSPDELHPEVWPSNEGARRVLERFSSVPVTQRNKKMMDQEGFTRQQVIKLQHQLKKQELENRELETAIAMHKCLSGQQGLEYMNIEELTNLLIMVDAKLKAVNDRIEHISVQMTSNDAAIVVQQNNINNINNNNNNNNLHQRELAGMETMQTQQTWFTDIMSSADNDLNVYTDIMNFAVDDPSVCDGGEDAIYANLI